VSLTLVEHRQLCRVLLMIAIEVSDLHVNVGILVCLTLFDVRLEAFLYSLLRSCLALEPMRTRSPTFLIPISLRWVWSISMRFSPLMWLSVEVRARQNQYTLHLRLKRSTYWLQLISFSQLATLSSSQCLRELAILVTTHSIDWHT
jgi:hypothetical protein